MSVYDMGLGVCFEREAFLGDEIPDSVLVYISYDVGIQEGMPFNTESTCLKYYPVSLIGTLMFLSSKLSSGFMICETTVVRFLKFFMHRSYVRAFLITWPRYLNLLVSVSAPQFKGTQGILAKVIATLMHACKGLKRKALRIIWSDDLPLPFQSSAVPLKYLGSGFPSRRLILGYEI